MGLVGITFGDPRGDASNEKPLIRCAHLHFCLSAVLIQASLIRPSANKNPHCVGRFFRLAEKEVLEPFLQYADNKLFARPCFCLYTVWFTRFKKLFKERVKQR